MKTENEGAAVEAWWSELVPPAPGDLWIVQALMNTLRPERSADELTSPLVASDWLARRGLLAASTEISEPDHRRLVAVRDGLRALARSNNGLPWDEAAVARLNRATADVPIRVDLGSRSTRFEPASAGVDGVLGGFVGIVVAARMEAVWRRLKLCGGDCGLSFYDPTSRCARRWCSMERCGNRMKARAYRHRKAG